MPLITQAFLLGAGLGTRLRPLTEDLPKPLVPIFQKPLMTFALDHLIAIGVEKLHVNTHHLPERFADAFPHGKYGDRTIKFYHEPRLLETAGGLANIANTIDDASLLVYNADILSDLPLAPLLDAHFHDDNLVTLALRSGPGPKEIALDEKTLLVVDIGNRRGSKRPSLFVFTGIYIVAERFVRRLERGVKRSVIPHFVEAIDQGERIGGVIINDEKWWDVGTPEAYLQLHRTLRDISFPSFPIRDRDWRAAIHPTAQISTDAVIAGCSVVGANATVDAGVRLHDTIVWPGARIASHSDLQNCIVRSRRTAASVLRDVIV